MLKYAKVIDESTRRVEIGTGTNETFYASIGMEWMDVDHGYDGYWYVAGYAPAQPVEELRAEKLKEINAAYDAATSALVATYPQTELLTFDKQEAEARAWTADHAAGTPLVDMLAAGRQMDKAELVRRIIAKADAFALAAGYLTGQRQRYEDMLAAAQTAEDVASIVPEYILPQGISS